LTSLGWTAEHRSQVTDQLEKSLDDLADEVGAAMDMNEIGEYGQII
jgi:hypothetical protein